jgi:hypothetical protein
MPKHNAHDAVAQATELRDAAINASAFAWRITGADAGPLIKSGDALGQPVSPDEVASALADSFGWATLGDTAQRLADAWTQAAKAWHAAEAQLRVAQTVALADLRRQQGGEASPPARPAAQDTQDTATAPPPQEPEPFHVTTRPSHRSMRRSTLPNGGPPPD